MGRGNVFVNALIGAVVTVVTVWLPFSPVLGGAVAGYLNEEDGLKVGAISGAISALPLLLLLLFVFGISGFLFLGLPDAASIGFLFGILGLFFVGGAFFYTVVLGAIGGWLGVYILEETDIGKEPSDTTDAT